MAEETDLDDAMDRAWATRRRSFAAEGNERDALIRDAHRQLEAVVATCRAAGTDVRLAHAVHLLANVEHDMGKDAAALALWQEAVSICRTVGDLMQLAHKVRHLGDLQRHLGNVDAADTCYAEALSLYRAAPDPPALDYANAAARMAHLRKDVRIWQEARDRYEAAGVAAGVEECAKQIARLGGS